jgi:hypothetical protein
MDYNSDMFSSSEDEEADAFDAYPAWAFEHYIYEGVNAMYNTGPLPHLDPDIKCYREMTYDRIEAMLERRLLPPVIESIFSRCTAFDIREAAVGPITTDIDAVVPPNAAESWRRFWEGRPENIKDMWTFENWDNLGEFCLELLDCCDMPTTEEGIKSCMIRLLDLCHFLKGADKPHAGP